MVDKHKMHKFLPYTANVDARSIYRALEKHFKVGIACKQCSSYDRYGLMLIEGDYDSVHSHLEYVANEGRKNAIEHFEWSLGQVTDSGLLRITQRDERLHEVIFTQLAPKEVLAL
jgi:hypothetical protein